MLDANLHSTMSSIATWFDWLPYWLPGLLAMTVSAALVLLLYRWVIRTLIRVSGRYSTFLPLLLARSEWPACAMLLIIVLGAELPAAQLPSVATAIGAYLLLVGFILTLGWAAGKALDLASDLYLRRFQIDVEDNLLARKHLTQVNILRRAARFLLIMITFSAALMTIGPVRQYGVSLFASAGAAGLVVGLAARPVLSNLLAGLQIAMTQPISVDDAVVVEGEWGWIETIGSTYVVIRIWDQRRLIVPLTYFIEKPFQNWTHKEANLLGSVILNVDYSVPVQKLRAKLEEIVHDSPLWDRKVVVLQVTDTPNNMVELRALVSARNSGTAWDLRCAVREGLIAFLQQEYPDALPRQRIEVINREGARSKVAEWKPTMADADQHSG